MRILFVLCFFILTSSINAQSIVGTWKSIDDETKKAKSVVQIYKKGNLYYGKIIKLFRSADKDQNPKCTECNGDKKDKPIIGLEIITKMKYDKSDDEYDDGEILDPESGKVYDCKLWVEDGKLKVRGYIAFFYRTQTWLPYNK